VSKRETIANLRACAVLERTGDGRSVGRCWFDTGKECVCPRHGDVRAVQKRYLECGKLTDERDLPSRGAARGGRETK
jgi:hypothetical protein